MFVRQQLQFKERLVGSGRIVDTLWRRKLRTEDTPLQFASHLSEFVAIAYGNGNGFKRDLSNFNLSLYVWLYLRL